MCELLDPLRGFRNKSSEVPPDHPLKSVVETLNHGIMCVLSAIREGVELVTTDVLMERREKITALVVPDLSTRDVACVTK